MEQGEKEETKEEKKEEKEEEKESNPDYEILREDFPHYDLSFKLIVIGNAGVGKSCLSMQATKKRFGRANKSNRR